MWNDIFQHLSDLLFEINAPGSRKLSLEQFMAFRANENDVEPETEHILTAIVWIPHNTPVQSLQNGHFVVGTNEF